MVLGYKFGYQRSICVIIMPYKEWNGVYKNFASRMIAKICLAVDPQLKNKNIFARMISDSGISTILSSYSVHKLKH